MREGEGGEGERKGGEEEDGEERERETMYWLTSLKSPVVDFFQRWLEWPA